MVRSTITTSIDAEMKEKALPIIRYELRKPFSKWLDEKLKEVIEQNATA